MVLPEADKWNTPDESQYDAGFVAYLGMVFDPTRSVVDVGANVGKVAKFLALRTRCQVLCFEPGPATFEALKQNVGGLPNVTLERCAIGASCGSGSFVGDGTVTAHLTDSGRGSLVEVEVKTLDTAVPAGIDIGLLKIDVEGGEMEVLQGAKATIQRSRPLIAIEVIDGHLKRGGASREQIFQFLKEFGYTRAVNKYGMTERSEKPTGASDIFFLPHQEWYAPRLYIGYDRLMKKLGPLFES